LPGLPKSYFTPTQIPRVAASLWNAAGGDGGRQRCFVLAVPVHDGDSISQRNRGDSSGVAGLGKKSQELFGTGTIPSSVRGMSISSMRALRI
jgi:hypothetical protein